jgi:hypothetical protein
MGRENDLEGEIVSNVACAYATSATHVREQVNAHLREARRPSFSSVQIAQGCVKIQLSHERRRRVQTRAKRLAYCILAYRQRAPCTAVALTEGGTGTRVRARLRNAPQRASVKYSITATESMVSSLHMPHYQTALNATTSALPRVPILRRITGQRTAWRPIMSLSAHVRLHRRLLQWHITD